jgi:serine/threonine protein kinase
MARDVGTSINQYKIISRLGAGGMGEVYLAQDVRLERKVALKLLNVDVTKNEEWVRRFEQEARAASALNHPNIITIYEVGQLGDSHFISAEFIEGDTLRQRLGQHTLTMAEALDIGIQVGTALVAAHAAGIIHRDIKPENVMLRPDGYVKVLDFGLAKFSEHRPSGASGSNPDAATNVDTDPRRRVTVSYVARPAAGIDARSMPVSACCSTSICRVAGPRSTTQGSSFRSSKGRGRWPFTPDIPPELERIVAKSLSKNREDRYQTLKDMLIDLKRLKQQFDLEAQLIDLPDEDLPEQISSRQQLATVANVGVTIATGPQKAFTREISVQHHPSSAEYIVTGLKRYKKVVLIIAAAAVVASVGLWYYFSTRPIDSIAVLPFNSLNPDPGTEQLCDEIAENIISDLSQSSGLRVMSFAAVQHYRGRTSIWGP